MIVVTVDLWPGGDALMKKVIGTAHIFNKSNLADTSDYGYSIIQHPSKFSDGFQQFGEITKHDRNQSVWRLIGKAIERGVE